MNNTGRILSRNKETYRYSKFHNNGEYQLSCPNCPLIYTGQTGRQFPIRYK